MMNKVFHLIGLVALGLQTASAGHEPGQPRRIMSDSKSWKTKGAKGYGNYYSYEYKGKGGKSGSMMRAMGKGKGKGYGRKGMSMKSTMGKGKGKGKGADAYYYDDYLYDACSPVIDGIWTYASDDSTFFSDIGGDGFVDAGDSFIFDEALLTVYIDTTVIATGSFSGVCTATPELTEAREYCILNYDFGDLGTVAVQGPLEAMTIAGTTGCFSYYTGEVNGFVDETSVYVFGVNALAR